MKRFLIPAVVFALASVALVAWFFSSPPETGLLSKPSSVAQNTTASGKPPARPTSRALGGQSPNVAGPSSTAPSGNQSTASQPAPVPAANSVPSTGCSTVSSAVPTPSTARASGTTAEQASGTVAPTHEAGGLVVKAQVVAGGQNYSFAPNSLGLFPRVQMGLEDTASVAVSYPGGAAGDLVIIQSEDGGTLEGGKTVVQAHLDENLQVRFPFKSTQEGGIYRVTLRNGFDEKRLEFWGGREPLVQNTNQ